MEKLLLLITDEWRLTIHLGAFFVCFATMLILPSRSSERRQLKLPNKLDNSICVFFFTASAFGSLYVLSCGASLVQDIITPHPQGIVLAWLALVTYYFLVFITLYILFRAASFAPGTLLPMRLLLLLFPVSLIVYQFVFYYIAEIVLHDPVYYSMRNDADSYTSAIIPVIYSIYNFIYFTFSKKAKEIWELESEYQIEPKDLTDLKVLAKIYSAKIIQ